MWVVILPQWSYSGRLLIRAFTTQCLLSRLATGIIVWLLSETDSPLANTVPQVKIVRSRCMVDTSVVPDGKIILILPPVPDLQIMVFYDKVYKLIEEMATLPCGQAVDVVDVGTNSENALPSSHGIGAHDRVDGGEFTSDVLRRSSGPFVDVEAVRFGSLVEFGLSVGCCQAFEEAL